MGRFSQAASRGAGASLGALRSRVTELETLQQSFGARDAVEDSPGLFRRAVDLLSRGEFASAGLVEELVEGEGILSGIRRAGREIFSGVGPIKGEKRGYGEVLERLGVGELGSLGDVVPQVEGTFFDVTGRGTLGLVLGVAADPLSWVTAGVSRGVRASGGVIRIGGRIQELGSRTRFTTAGIERVGADIKALLPRRRLTGPELRTRLGPEAAGRVEADAVELAAEQFERRLDASLREAGLGTKAAARARGDLARRKPSVVRGGGPEAKVIREALGVTDDATSEALERSLKEAVDRDAKAMLRQGIEPDTPLWDRARAEARVAAEKRVIAAAKAGERGLIARGGIRFAGLTIPGTDLVAPALAAVSPKVVAAIARTSRRALGEDTALRFGESMRGFYDAMGALFNRDWTTRRLAGFNTLKQAHLDFAATEVRRWGEVIERSDSLKWLDGQGEEVHQRVYRAIERGTEGNLTGRELSAAGELRPMFDEFQLTETQRGVLPAERVRDNYIPIMTDNDPLEFTGTIISDRLRADQIDLASLGGFAEARSFRTMDEAVAYFDRLHRATGGTAPKLRPIWNPVEVLRRRAMAHAHSVSFDNWYKTVAREFGQRVPFNREAALAMSHSWRPATEAGAREYVQLQRLLAGKDKTAVAALPKLSREARREFLRERAKRIATRDDLNDFMRRYESFFDDFPGTPVAKMGQLADDGTPYVRYTANKQLGNIFLPKSIVDDLETMNDTVRRNRHIGALLHNYDRATNFFKTWVTVYFPAFNFRNAYSNVAQNFLDIGVAALDPRIHRHAAAIMAGRDGVFETAMGPMTYKEVRRLGRDNNIGVTIQELSEAQGQAARQQVRGGKLSKPQRAARTIATSIENEARFTLFLRHLQRGETATEAARRVKDVLFDYQNLSVFERDWLRRTIPFYVWTSKNVRFLAKKMAQEPGRAAILVKPFRGREDENEHMVSWEAEALKLRLNRDGNTVSMLTGVDLPIRGLDVIWRGSLSETFRQNLGMINPLLQAPVQVATGKSLFTGRDLTRTESAAVGRIVQRMPDAIQDWMGYRKSVDDAGRSRYSFDGERFYLLFQSFAWSRIVSTSDRQWREYANDSNWSRAILDVATGLRRKDVNLTEQQERRLKERVRGLEEALERRGVLRRGQHVFDVSEGAQF